MWWLTSRPTLEHQWLFFVRSLLLDRSGEVGPTRRQRPSRHSSWNCGDTQATLPRQGDNQSVEKGMHSKYGVGDMAFILPKRYPLAAGGSSFTRSQVWSYVMMAIDETGPKGQRIGTFFISQVARKFNFAYRVNSLNYCILHANLRSKSAENLLVTNNYQIAV